MLLFQLSMYRCWLWCLVQWHWTNSSWFDSKVHDYEHGCQPASIAMHDIYFPWMALQKSNNTKYTGNWEQLPTRTWIGLWYGCNAWCMRARCFATWICHDMAMIKQRKTPSGAKQHSFILRFVVRHETVTMVETSSSSHSSWVVGPKKHAASPASWQRQPQIWPIQIPLDFKGDIHWCKSCVQLPLDMCWVCEQNVWWGLWSPLMWCASVSWVPWMLLPSSSTTCGYRDCPVPALRAGLVLTWADQRVWDRRTTVQTHDIYIYIHTYTLRTWIFS